MAAVAPGIAHDLVTTCVCLEYLTANPCLRQTSMPTFGRTARRARRDLWADWSCARGPAGADDSRFTRS